MRLRTLLMTAMLLVLAAVHVPAFGQDPFRTDYEPIFVDIYGRVAPSVVSINVLARSASDSPLFDDSLLQGGGTGFVYDQAGHIITNNHVVDGADEIVVYFLDGTIARATVVGVDPDSDIAVIEVTGVPPERLLPVNFGNSAQLRVGQGVLAIGSPFGEDWTLTSGIISAVNRSIRGLAYFSTGAVIQTDASIKPGNSGGPLLNLQGQVIGVNSQILSATRSNSGIGFAVPSNLVQRVVREIIEVGRVEYSYMGISGGDMSIEIVEQFSLPNNLRGAVVNSVVPASPAASAGLRNPSSRNVDIIVAIDGAPIHNMDDLLAYLAENTRPNVTVNLTVYREGNSVNVPMTLGARPR